MPVGPHDPQVVAGVGDGQADRAGRPGVGDAQRADAGAGQRGWRAAAGRRGPRRGPGPGSDGSAGSRAIAASSGTDSRSPRRKPAGGDRGGGAAQPAAGQPVPPGVQGGRRGQGVGQAAQPRPCLRGGGRPVPAAGPVAGLDGGGGGDGVADQGFPLRARRAWRWPRGSRRPARGRRGPRPGVRLPPWPPGLARSEQPGGEPGGLPGALPAGGAAGLAEPGSGDRPGQDLHDGVLAAGQAGRRRRPAPAAAPPGHGRSTAAGSPGGPAAASPRPPAAPGGSGGPAGAVTVCAPGQAASTARSIRPGGTVPGTHRRMVIPAASPPAQAYSQPRCGCPCHQPGPGRAQQPGQVPPQRHRPGRVGLRRGQDRDQPGSRGEGGVLAAAQPRPAQRAATVTAAASSGPATGPVVRQGGEQQPGQVRGRSRRG